MAEDWSFGIEEASPTARAAARRTKRPPIAFTRARRVELASHEVLKGQVEVQSQPGTSHDDAHRVLAGLRRELSDIAADGGLQVFAAGSHPLADEREQSTTQKDRYRQLERDYGIIASRSMACALHVHVSVPEPRRRVDLMNRVLPFLPLFYALSTGSPFWQGRDTRLKGFRLAAYAQWPRMGLPETFRDDAEYERFVARLVESGVMPDASFVWWLIRPSTKYPTLELRICDSCTRVEDAVAIAALYRSLLRAVHRRPELNAGTGPFEHAVCAENVWQAQQAGTAARFVDAATGQRVPVRDTLEAAIALCAEDAGALDCTGWVGCTRDILGRGSSADRQIAAYEAAGCGAEAFAAVVAALSAETALV